MKNTLLLVFIHGFKGSDHTFHGFPKDLRALIAHTLPEINVLAITYPQYETRGDLRDCVARFKEWLQNKVIDLEVANQTPSPTVDPSVHVVLCGHSMGGIVAAETVLSIARDEPVPSSTQEPPSNSTTNSSTTPASSSAPTPEASRLFFPYIRAVLAFDTPFLGISPGVLAHGAEEQGVTAYKAWDTASKFFGWGSPKSSSPAPIANASERGLPAPNGTTTGGSSRWGKYAMYGGAAAAVAGVAGAAYLNWNQINQGLSWAGSHLEFVGCLARGAELQKRVEKIVSLSRTHDVGFANFYGVLGEQVTSRTKYAGAVLGQDRTFCVVPKNTRKAESPTGAKRDRPSSDQPSARPRKRRSNGEADLNEDAAQSEQVHDFAEDTTKSKGLWVKCINPTAKDELASHTTMFSSDKNGDYHAMLPRARDQIVEWIDEAWYESSSGTKHEAQSTNEGAEEERLDPRDPVEEDEDDTGQNDGDENQGSGRAS